MCRIMPYTAYVVCRVRLGLEDRMIMISVSVSVSVSYTGFSVRVKVDSSARLCKCEYVLVV